jgi:hypothetical protein
MTGRIVCGPPKKLVGQYDCPVCSALAGQLCVNPDGQALSDFHAERLKLVLK